MLHNSQKDFIRRHIGPSDKDQQKMLKELNFNNLDELINSTVPKKIKFILILLEWDTTELILHM